MRLQRFSPLCVFAVAMLSAAVACAQQIAPAVRIASPIDEHQLVTLKGTVHALANPRNDLGLAPDQTQLDRMHLVLKRSAAQESALQTLIGQMHAPGAASYHKWLTPDDFGKQFGPADEDIATVSSWLSKHGFAVSKVLPGKQVIEFSGNAGQFRTAFHSQIHKYQVNGQVHLANAADPQIPAALSSVVGGFASLNNFQLKSYAKYLGKAQYDPKTDQAVPEWTIGSSTAGYNFVLAPQDYAVQYDLNPLYTAGTNGSGQTIAIVNESNINIGLVNNFRSLFSLPVNPPQVIIDGNDPGVDGINNPDGPNGASVEAYLDVEWAGAVAPDATIDLVIGGDTALESGLALAAEHAVYSNIAPIISLSFGQCEATLGASGAAFFSNLWEQAAAQGITVLVSTGDSGSAGCDSSGVEYAIGGQAVSGLASTPYNVAVGGTDFYYSDFSSGLTAMETQMNTYWSTTPSNSSPAVSIKGVIPEQPWNDSQYGLTIATLQNGDGSGGGTLSYSSVAAGSGGSSVLYTTKPAWQTGFGDSVRDLPDVSLFASNGVNASFYPICAVDGDCQAVSSGSVQFSGVGGTSASTPAFAGIMALVNQLYGRQGQADFVLYPLSKQVPAAFNDVANGTITVPCEMGSTNCIAVSNPGIITLSNGSTITEGEIGTGTTPWYNAVAGYDEASGLGTIDANQLVTNWTKVKFTPTTTTLTPSSTNFTHGTAITINGTVSATTGTPTGDVALMTDSPAPMHQGMGLPNVVDYGTPSSFALSSGAFTGTISTLPGGTYNIWGQYGGDTNDALSTSTPVSITVTPENSGIYFSMHSPFAVYTATATPGSSVDYGTQLSLSAQVYSSAQTTCVSSGNCSGMDPATGSIAFSDNGTAIDTAPLNSEGDAAYNAPFSVGAHSVTASYAGDSSYNASTASAIAFTVVQDTPAIALSTSVIDGSNNNLLNGPSQPTVLTVQIENGAQNGVAGSTIYPVPVAPPTGNVTLSSSLSGFSGTSALSSAVDPSTGAATGLATFTVPAGTVSGTYTVSVSYNGDTNYKSTSKSYSIPIETTSGDGALTSTIAATATGSISPTTNVTISGTVSGPSGNAAPTGSLYVYSSGNYPAGVNIAPGSGNSSTFSIVLNSQNLSQGSNQITLQYFGDSKYNPSALVLSNPVSNPASDFTLIAASPNVAIAAPGDSGTVQVTATSMRGFTGAISLTTSGNSAVGVQIPASVTLTSNGAQTFNVVLTPGASLKPGTYPIEIIGTDSSGKYVHTIGINAVIAATATPAFLVSTAGSLSVAHGATTGNTLPIAVTPTAGFTGTVNLTCAVTSTPASATSPVTCSIPASVSITGTTAASATLTVSSTDTTTLGAYQISVTGKDAATGKLTSTGVENITVVGITPTVQLTPSATNVTTAQTFQIGVVVSGSVGTPTGVVTLTIPQEGQGVSQNGTLVNGAYTFNIHPAPTLVAGGITINVSYGGDATYGTASGSTNVTVTPLTPNVTEVLSQSAILTNQPLTVTGTVTGSATVPTGAINLYASGASFTATLTSTGAYSITVPANSFNAGNDTVDVTYFGDNIYTTAVQQAALTVTQFVPPIPTVTVTPASTTADTGSSLAVTGTVAGSGGTPTGTVIITAGSYTSGAITLTAGAYSGAIPGNSLSAGTDTITVTYSGDSNFAVATGTASVTVTASVFTVAATSPAAVTRGSSASSTVTVASTTGYTGTISLTCALTNSPAGATYLPTCTEAGAGTVALTASSQTATLAISIGTTAATTGAVVYPKTGGKGWAGAGGGAVLAFLLFFGIPARRRTWRAMLGMVMLMAALGSLAACGGGSGGGGGGGTTGTTAGTYTFTVTATGAPATASAPTTTFTVTVN